MNTRTAIKGARCLAFICVLLDICRSGDLDGRSQNNA